jgi:hypothetical protein
MPRPKILKLKHRRVRDAHSYPIWSPTKTDEALEGWTNPDTSDSIVNSYVQDKQGSIPGWETDIFFPTMSKQTLEPINWFWRLFCQS